MTRRPIIGVMGSGREAHEALAAPLGVLLATRGVHLLTGGGRGVMQAVSEAFVSVRPREGLSIGVLPARDERTLERPPDGYPNPAIELPIATHLPCRGDQGKDPLSRNHINVLSATAIIALPGGPGTRSEVELALRYDRPIALYGPVEAFAGFPPEPPRLATLEALAAWLDDRLRA